MLSLVLSCLVVCFLTRQVQDSLEGVEHRFRETAHKAVRIGDRLSKMEGQRSRAAEAMELLEFFKVLTVSIYLFIYIT